jgi:hypothetical protein
MLNLIHEWIPLPKNGKILILNLTSNITGTPCGEKSRLVRLCPPDGPV